MADIREQDLALKTTLADTDWIRLVTTTGNHRMTVGKFKDLIGHIEESGSNTNGRYIRFSDGTQICWHSYVISDVVATAASGALYVSGSYDWTFPATFSENPAVSGLSNPSGGTSVFLGGVNLASTSAVTFRIVSLVSATITAVRTTWIAIGRWK